MSYRTKQELEEREANRRARAFLGKGSRPALLSRAVVGGFVLVICLLLWIVRLLA